MDVRDAVNLLHQSHEPSIIVIGSVSISLITLTHLGLFSLPLAVFGREPFEPAAIFVYQPTRPHCSQTTYRVRGQKRKLIRRSLLSGRGQSGTSW